MIEIEIYREDPVYFVKSLLFIMETTQLVLSQF